MNKHVDLAEFLPKPATRERVPLNLALEGPPGGGKTGSALLLAQGIQDVHGGPIRLIDTEARRSTKFLGERIGDSRPFAFDIVDFRPPFRADHYKAALQAALQTAPAPCCVIVDSISDEHEGIGGRLDWHEEEITALLTRMRRDPKNWQERQKVDQSGWQPASAARKDLIRWAMQVDQCPIIWTIRAREKTKPVEKEKNGRTVAEPTNIGFVPIAPVELVHAMDLVCLLPPRADGVPLWRTDRQFEDFVLKLPQWFKPMFAEPGPITSEHGRAMELWAAGKNAVKHVSKHVSHETPSVSQEEKAPAPAGRRPTLREAAEAQARESRKALVAWSAKLKPNQQNAVADWWEDLLKLSPDAGDELPGLE